MQSIKNWRNWVVVLGIALIASPAFAQTTGLIEGTVFDNEDKALPGVTFELTSPAMQGTRVAISDANGKFRFPAIPPGEYTMMVTLSGFGSLRHEDIDVGLDKTVTLRVGLQPAAFEEVVEVTGEAPVVDVTSTELGVNYDEDMLTSMPLGRNFAAVAGVLGGAQYEDDTTGGYAIYGSSGAENVYIIDGVDSTEVERGRQGKTVNMEFVEEIQIKTGGYNAEYGRATGGVINVITKSGGNDFHGDVFGYYHTDDTQEDFDGKGFDDLVNAPTTSSGITRQDYGFDLGGYIVRDKLWFFLAYDLVKREDRELISEITQERFGAPPEAVTDREEDQRAVKLTWNLNPSHTLVGSLFGDPEDWQGANGYEIRGNEDTWTNTRETGGDNYTFKYLGLPSADILINAQWAHHEEEDTIAPQNSTDVQFRDRRAIDEFRDGGIGGFFSEEYEREAWQVDLTWFAEAAGSHELKFGYGEQENTALKHVQYSGGQVVWLLSCTPGGSADCDLALTDPVLGDYYYAHEVYLTPDSRLDDWTASPDGYSNFPITDNTGAFVQDSWRVLSNLTLNLGVRWEEQILMDDSGREWIKLDDNWAPRLGVVWDVKNDGSSKAYFHYGEFFENIPMDINIRFMGSEVDGFFYNTDPNDINPNEDLRSPRIRGSSSLLQLFEDLFGSAVDPNLEGQSVDEWILGYEANLIPNWTFGISGVFRELNTVIEDGGASIEGELAYIVGNGGEGLLSEAPDLHFTDAFPTPKPKREYTAVQLTAQRRYRDNWTLYASYVWSELEGNYDGTYQRSTGQLDPNINSSYDYVDFMYVVDTDNPFTTALDGPLSNDREHQVKVSGFYNFDFGLEVGATAYWQTGRPLSAQGWSDAYRNNELWLTQRGALGEMPDEYELDLHFGYPINAGPVTVNLLLDIFNVLDEQSVTDVDMLYDLSEGELVPSRPGCESYAGSSYSPSTPAQCAPNPDFQKGIVWTAPRFVRVGAKISF
jgi:hypothetical protein